MMKSKKILASLALIASFAASHGAQASTFSLWQGGTSYLNAGLSYTSSFDGNLLFTPGVDVISNASLTLNFIGSNQTVYQGTSSTVTRTFVDDFGTVRQTVDTTSSYADLLDSVNVLIGKKGGQTATGNDVAGAYSSSVTTSTTPIYVAYYSYYECGSLWVSHTCVSTFQGLMGYSQSITQTSGYKGLFSVTAGLDSTSLNLFESNGLLRYGFTVTGGGVALESAILTFDVTSPQVLNATPPAAVPLPAALPLMASGLGLLGLGLRRRKSEPTAKRCF